MNEALKLSLTQKLQQRLSPLQMRFARMLEMSQPEVEEEVTRELDDNPALEEVDTPVHDDFIPAYRLEARNHSADDRYFEPIAVAGGESLMDALMTQLRETDLTPKQLDVARYIVGNLDDNGYMTRTVPQITDDLALGAGIDVTEAQVRDIVDRIRSLDPPGVGAYDLRDCIALQLRRLPSSPQVNLALDIVNHYFDLFSHRHYDRLLSALGVDSEQLREAEDVIKSLNPKPAARFDENEADSRTRHIIPDFNVEVDEEGRITVSMPGNVPELTIEQSFATDSPLVVETPPNTKAGREALAFVTRKREEASDFIELLRQRKVTLMRIMEAIARIQREFFITDDEATLKPMRLKDIAALTDYDLSVISRATSGKYVATRSGTYPLKFFFNESVSEDEGASSREVLAVIKELIANEEPDRPLNDDSLTKELTRRGYGIARRTVAKYREKLGFPVARLRKKL